MKARRKWNRLFAMLLVATLIFNSQATALLAMDGESFGVAGDKTGLLSGTGGSAEIIDEGDTQIIPDGEVEASSFGSGTQAGNGQDNSFLLGQEVVPGTAPVADQEKESEADTLTEAEKEMLTNSSDSENESGADEEFGPALGVEEDSDITIVEEETEPQTSEQGENAQEAEEEDDVEVMEIGLDDGIMLTGLDWQEKATIEDTTYSTLAEAFASEELQDGVTVKLQDGNLSVKTNLDIDLMGKSVTLDLNNRKIVSPLKNVATIKVKNGNLKIINGTIGGGPSNSDPNASEYSGGCLHAEENVNLDLENIKFSTSYRRGNGGGAIYQSGGKLIMHNVSLEKAASFSIAPCGGMFMYVSDGCELSMDDVVLSGLGAMGNSYSVAYFKDCSSVSMQKVSITDGSGNKTASDTIESIIRLDNCNNVSISNSTLTNNNCASAAIAVLNNSVATLFNSNLSGNKSAKGSVYVGKDGNLTITDTTITGEAESNGLYVAAGGSVTMTGSDSALYGSRIQDVVIEEGALSVSLPAVAEMNIPSDLKPEYQLWIKEGESKNGLSGELKIAPAEEQSAYKVSAIKSDEAQIIREGEDDPILCSTFVKAVQDAQDGDIIQLLPDTLDSEAEPKNRVIKLRETANIKSNCSITIDLNQQELNLSEASSDKAYISIQAGAELTVKGPGRMTGGYKNPKTININEAIWVGTKADTKLAHLTVTNYAYVSGIKNYGITKITNNAQMSQIALLAGKLSSKDQKFILDTTLEKSLYIVLDSATDAGKLTSKVYLTLGEQFSMGTSVEKIDFTLSNAESLTSKTIENGFKKWFNTEGAETIPLIKCASVIPKDVKDSLVKIVNIINVPADSTECTASICAIENDIELFRNEGFVYLGGSDADDDNIGYSNTAPVATMKKAIELAQAEGAKRKIYLVGTVEVTGEQGAQTWDMPDDISFELYGEFAENGHSGPFAEVEEGGSLTLQKIEIKGAGTDVTSNAPLIKVNNGGKLFITNGATLSDNNHGYNNYGSVGGAVYSDGGEIIMDGGVIRNCKAYNGGAVYCNGGSFIMSGGTLGGTLDEKSAGNSAKEAGGAVMLANGARMTLSGSALISENTATDSVIIGYDELGPIYGGNGGGIAVGGCRADSVTSTPYLEMRGGRISHNKMYTCGGGIFVQANAEAKIFAGMIDHNTDMASSGNYSGGGIYVNGARGEIDKPAKKPGYLYLENVLITGNVARHDVGGGIAACPTASAKIFLLDGAAIYGNKYGDAQTARVPSDILIRRDSFQSPGTEIDISEYMSNGQPYLWKEYNGSDDSGVGGLHRSDDDMSLCNLYTDQEYKDDISKDFSVLIISNDGYQAGGGIGTNGTVEIGTKPDVVSISAKKVWVDTGRETNRPKGKIKVWLLRKTESGKFERVAAEYLKPDADGNWGSETVVTFPEQPKYVPGTKTLYEYRVEEAKGIGPYTSTVTKGEEDNSWVITNTYTPAQTTAMIEGTKVLTGREWTDVDSFTFELTETTTAEAGKTIPDALDEPLKATATKAAQDFDFGEFKYTEPYVHTYEVKETGKPGKGITMDGNTYTVTVTVTDKGDGTMSSAVSYPQTEQDAEGKETPATKLTFTNIYKAAAGSIQLRATKAFDRTLTGGEFTFVLQEVDSDGKTVAEGVRQEKTNGSDGKVLFDEITYNETGTYYYQISEVAGFDPTILSYDTAVKTVTVTVKDVDAKLVATADQTADEVVFTNTSVKAKIDKQDADTGASIPGAVLRIVDKKNADAVVEQWTSNGKPHEIIGKLSKNGSYVLEEVTAPDGYLPTDPIDFTVNKKGETIIGGIVTDVVVMKDTKNTISLLKVDESGQPLAGAHLVIENAEGTAMDSWVSDGEPHETRGLARGHYVMSEVEAPAGYHVAEDVPFEIMGDETEPVEVRMADKKIPVADNNKLTVMKHLKLDGITCDIGIHEAEFYVALFSDEERTHRVSDVKKIEFHDNALSTVTFENLGRGTYYVGETDENGVLMLSKKVNDQVIYYAEYGENSSVQFEGSTGEGTAELTNVYVEFPEERYYLSGRLTITKNVLVEGQEAASDDTFYAGIFSDAALTSRVGDVVAIEMNGGSSASVTVYNLAIGESIDSSETYYVAETDANGTPLNPDEITEYRISVDKSEVIMDADHADQEVVITNDFVEEIETEEEEEEEENISDSSGSGPESGTTAPKTGDETDSVLYLLYMALSVGLFAVAAGEKRRRQRRVKK